MPYRIRVQAPHGGPDRAGRQAATASTSDTARWLCEKTDSERACFLHAIYGRRWDDPSEYDRVFDAGNAAYRCTLSRPW